jgi:SET domain-containing protein 6
MITTQPIPAGQQIYNTYAHPPNSDLLRRYGHVDIIPPSLVGNEEDEVEIRCDLVVEIVKQMLIAKGGWDEKEWDMDGRVEFWLEEGGDE